ncbi:thioredoxin domain-containing protein [Angustibacter sp. McL0619]|uniref:thioredoxin domain-containing protein n=1 Tax=Angustibacter sp. McL0619 TaxID=3415676 RepID=UPI003CF9F5C7
MTSGKASRETREAKAAERRASAAKAESRRRNGIITAVVAVVVLVVVGAYVLIQNDNSSKTGSSSNAAPKNTQGKANQTIVVGSPSATVLVTAYEDFQCPVCKQFEQTSGPVLLAYLNQQQIKMNYRPIAFLDSASTTNYSTRALNSAGCVVDTKLDAFQAYHKLLFENQPAEGSAGLPNSKLIELAKQAGAGDISACVNAETFKGWTVAVTDQASKDGVNGTPTVKVNEQVLTNPSPTELKSAIDAALK